MNPGMRMYLMTDGQERGRMEAGDGKYQERGIGTDERGYALPYHEPRPEFGETEARYRGENGRWKSGRRNEYNGGTQSRYSAGGKRSGGAMQQNSYKRQWEVSVEPKNERLEDGYAENRHMNYRYDPYDGGDPYMDEDDYDDPSGRVIGFGPPRNHKGAMRKGMPEMKKGALSMKGHMFGKEEAMEWTDGMENEDDKKPHGPMWDEAFLRPMAQKLGIPQEGPEFWEFYAVINAIHSDFCKVLSEFNADHPMCYGKLARAWIRDKDAVENKTQVYWECIVKPKLYEEA